MTDRVGFIGLGIMGKPMAKNLAKAGVSLVVCDIHPGPVQELVNEGAVALGTPAAVADQSTILFLMLPDGPQVEEVICGRDGVIETITAGKVVVDMSSISPTVSKKVATVLEEKGAHYVDAPVSGGEPGAVAGTVAIMVGGDEQIVERVRPLLAHMGRSVVRVGEVGAGQTVKLVNQVLVALHLAAMGEALVLAKRCGVDCGLAFEAVKGGLAGSNVLNAKVPLVLDRNFKPGFRMSLHMKDLRNAMAVADELGLELPLTEIVQRLLSQLVEAGHGEEDHGGLVQAVEGMNNVVIQ